MPGACIGTLTLSTASAVRMPGLRAVLQLGSARFDIAAGATKTLDVRVTSGLSQLVNRHWHVAVVVNASTGVASRIATSTQRLTLAPVITHTRKRR